MKVQEHCSEWFKAPSLLCSDLGVIRCEMAVHQAKNAQVPNTPRTLTTSSLYSHHARTFEWKRFDRSTVHSIQLGLKHGCVIVNILALQRRRAGYSLKLPSSAYSIAWHGWQTDNTLMPRHRQHCHPNTGRFDFAFTNDYNAIETSTNTIYRWSSMTISPRYAPRCMPRLPSTSSRT